MARLRAANRSLGDRPLVVLTHGQADDPDPGMSPELVAHLEAPKLVVAAVREVVDAR